MFTDAEVKRLQSLKTSLLQYYNKKMNELADPKITSLFYDNCIITGGCIASLYHYEPPNDIDLYAKDTKAIKIISALLTEIGTVIKEVKSYPDDTVVDDKRKLVTANAITLKNDVQFITLASADIARKTFDFIHCMPWFDIKTQKLYISEAQLAAIREKKLIPNMPHMTGRQPKEARVTKYVTRGWKTTWQVSPSTLTESLTSTSMTLGLGWKDDGMEFPGLVAQEMTALFPQTVALK